MARINFTSLKCVRKQDVTGKDEPEIWLDGKKKWDGVMKKGETVVLIPLFEDFEDSIKVELKERNPNSTKLLGTKTARPAGPIRSRSTSRRPGPTTSSCTASPEPERSRGSRPDEPAPVSLCLGRPTAAPETRLGRTACRPCTDGLSAS